MMTVLIHCQISTTFECFKHSYLIELDCSSGQFKSAKLKDKEYTRNAPSFFTILQKKKEIDAPSLEHSLADGQLLIDVTDTVSPSFRYLWFKLKYWDCHWVPQVVPLRAEFFAPSLWDLWCTWSGWLGTSRTAPVHRRSSTSTKSSESPFVGGQCSAKQNRNSIGRLRDKKIKILGVKRVIFCLIQSQSE